MSKCGLYVANPQLSNSIFLDKQKGKPAHYGNIGRCRSAWCVSCSSIFRKEKTERLRKGLNAAIQNNYHTHFITFTIPKAYGQTKDKFDVLNGVIRTLLNLLRGKCKRANSALFSCKGVDLTINPDVRDCLHLHTHSVIITENEIEGLRDYVWKTYSRLMKKNGVDVSELAFDFQKVDKNTQLDSYLTKSWENLDKELTNSDKLSKKKGSLGWFQFVRSMSINPTDRGIAIYKDFLVQSKGRRTIDFSRNFNELIDKLEEIDEEQSLLDELEQSSDVGEEGYYSFVIGSTLWSAIKWLKAEPLFLDIVDAFIDHGRRESDFKFILELMERSVSVLSYSEDIKKIYVAEIVNRFYYYS